MERLEIFFTDTLVEGCKKIVFAMLILAIGFWLVKWIIKKLKRGKLIEKLDDAAKIYMVNAVSIILRCIIVISVVAYLGVPMASVTAVLSSIGLALGLALQGGLSNIAGGIILLFTHPFKIGDFVIVGDLTGTVEAIGIYYTEITTPDNQKILIPNGTAANSEITNYTAKENRRLCVEYSISYDADIEKARAIMLSEAKNNKNVLAEPEPITLMTEHADSKVVLTLQVWIKNNVFRETKSELLDAVKRNFDAEGIKIPYPQMDVHIKDSL